MKSCTENASVCSTRIYSVPRTRWPIRSYKRSAIRPSSAVKARLPALIYVKFWPVKHPTLRNLCGNIPTVAAPALTPPLERIREKCTKDLCRHLFLDVTPIRDVSRPVTKTTATAAVLGHRLGLFGKRDGQRARLSIPRCIRTYDDHAARCGCVLSFIKDRFSGPSTSFLLVLFL